MKNSVSGNVGYASIRDRWHLMKSSGLKVKIILIEDVYKIPRSGSSADHRFPSKNRWRQIIGRARVRGCGLSQIQ